MKDLNKWTPPQQKVITHSAGNLLVSASAGSGKTSVLIEKIVDLIVHGGVKLKNLLVVTFTNSASIEIKQRLLKAIEESNDEKLLSELDELSTCDILTFDGFCLKVVREFGYEIGQNGNFSVADASLSGFLQNQALDSLFASHNKNYDERFMTLLDSFFAGRNDKTLKTGIANLYNFLRSKSTDFSYRGKLDEFYKIDNQNEAIKFLNDYILNLKNDFSAELKNLLLESKSYYDEKLTNSLCDAISKLDLIGEDFLKNLAVLRDDFSFEVPRKNKSDTIEVVDLKQSFLQCKNIFLSNLKKIITPEIKSMSVQKMNEDLFKTKQTLNYLFDVVDEFDAEYTKLKKNFQVLDFCDIETLANRILANKEIATLLQDRYDWIFIDEYQDTSLLQEDIITKVTKSDNLFMVGDLKQSIYRFRQAEPKIFINKYNQYAKMQNSSVVELKTNFRSENDILQFDNFVFDHIYRKSLDDFDYKGNADLEFGGEVITKSVEPKVNIFILKSEDEQSDIEEDIEKPNQANIDDGQDLKEQNNLSKVYSVKDSELVLDAEKSVQKEALLLAKKIKEMLNKQYFNAKTGKMQNITFGDIAVLSRRKSGILLETQKVLEKADIPVTSSFDENIFDCYDVQILINILKVVENSKNDVALISAMSNIGKFSFDELATIRQNFRDKTYFYEAVEEYKNSFYDELKNKIEAFFEKIGTYRRQSTHQDICELIVSIVNSENLEEYFTINGIGKEFDEHIRLLVSNFQSIKHYSLSEFVNYIDTFGSELTFQNNYSGGENSVTLSTIHASKGLEYPVVFLIGAEKDFNQKGETQKLLVDNDWGICMQSVDTQNRTAYDSLIKHAFKLKIKLENTREEKRLLYVALTRPKNYLSILGYSKTSDISSQKTDFEIRQSKNFLQWILGCFDDEEIEQIKTKSHFIKTVNDCDFNVELLDENFDFGEENLAKKPEQLEINKTEFYEILSQQFPKNNLAKKNSVSQILSEEEHYNISDFHYLKSDRQNDEDFLAVGTSYHKFMELCEFDHSKEKILDSINNLISSQKITQAEAELVDVSKIVSAVMNIANLIENSDIVLKEQQFLTYMPADSLVKTTSQNKILVQGVADLIIIKNDEIYLIDYKTSRLKDEKMFAERYKTQLDIYAKSIENFYQKPVTKKLVYSFYLDKLLII